MNKSIYTDLNELTESQTKIMNFIQWWVHEKKTPTPLTKIVKQMTKDGIKSDTIMYSVKILVEQGYIRKSLNGGGNKKTAFVQLRRI